MDKKNLKKIIIDDTEYSTRYTKKYENRKPWVPSKAEEIKTVIPGTVLTLNVKVGDKVALGDTLCLFEAMKMENIIRAPHPGIVREINVNEGDKLPKGTIMMLIEDID